MGKFWGRICRIQKRITRGVGITKRTRVVEAEGLGIPAESLIKVRQDRLLETAVVEFIDENGGGPGVRLRKRRRGKD